MSDPNRNGCYQPGDSTSVLTDLFPAAISPRPVEVPSGAKIRVIITTGCLTVAWLAGREGMTPIIGRVDIPLAPEDTVGVNHLGGQAGAYLVERGPGCSCGAAGLKNWQPYPDVTLLRANTYVARVSTATPQTRYSRN